jgi:adenylylsulfate kinase
MDDLSKQVTWHQSGTDRLVQEELKGHRSRVIWLTGLSGSGKSSVAAELERRLFQQSIHTTTLDGDNLRHGLNSDLGFSPEARKENIRRLSEVARLFTEAGIVVIVASISPFQADRDRARALFADDEFIEVYLSCPLEVCEQRDPKGLYKKARLGEIAEFTGISSHYEVPLHPELKIQTDHMPVTKAVDCILAYMAALEKVDSHEK